MFAVRLLFKIAVYTIGGGLMLGFGISALIAYAWLVS